jgi:DNA-binding IclR family transcriptional regulator
VLCVAQHANSGVVGAHDHRPGRARGAGVGQRARGYASEDGEYRDGFRAVAAPVRDPAGGPIAALVTRGDTADPPIP